MTWRAAGHPGRGGGPYTLLSGGRLGGPVPAAQVHDRHPPEHRSRAPKASTSARTASAPTTTDEIGRRVLSSPGAAPNRGSSCGRLGRWFRHRPFFDSPARGRGRGAGESGHGPCSRAPTTLPRRRRRACPRPQPLRPSGSSRDERRAALADHDARRVGVAADQPRHHRGIGDIEPSTPRTLSRGIDHRAFVRSHPRGPDWVVDGVGAGADQPLRAPASSARSIG